MRTLWPQASEGYLSNILLRLVRAGLLHSHRGVAGGYSLARPADEITLRNLAELLEGVEQGRCTLSLEKACLMPHRCKISSRIRELEEVYLESMDKVSMLSLAREIVVDAS
jgi:Rrf2 family protein